VGFERRRSLENKHSSSSVLLIWARKKFYFQLKISTSKVRVAMTLNHKLEQGPTILRLATNIRTENIREHRPNKYLQKLNTEKTSSSVPRSQIPGHKIVLPSPFFFVISCHSSTLPYSPGKKQNCSADNSVK
jgi:hypothetical protein